MGGGGRSWTEVHILYPKKSQLQNLSSTPKNPYFSGIPKKIPHKQQIVFILLLIWADERYNTQKNPCVFLQLQKIPASFMDPKKSLMAKFQIQKNLSDPPPISKICEWGPCRLQTCRPAEMVNFFSMQKISTL